MGQNVLQSTWTLLGAPLVGILVAATNIAAFSVAHRITGNPVIVPDMMGFSFTVVLFLNAILATIVGILVVRTPAVGRHVTIASIVCALAVAFVVFAAVSVFGLLRGVDGHQLLKYWIVTAVGLYILGAMLLQYAKRSATDL